MKVLKVIIAVILSVFLLCAQALLMGIIACNDAISSPSITKAVQGTNFTDDLYQKAQDSVDGDAEEKVTEFLNDAMQTDAASRFIGEYAASSIQSALGGESFSEFTKEDLQRLTTDSLDELSAESGLTITDAQRKNIEEYVEKNGDQLVRELNTSLPASNNPMVASSGSELAQLQTILDRPMQMVAAAVCLILGIMLIMLFWGSKLGFIWWAVISLLAGGAYFIAAASSDRLFFDFARQIGRSDSVAQLLSDMLSHGFVFSAIAALLLSAVLIVLCIICRWISRRRARD